MSIVATKAMLPSRTAVAAGSSLGELRDLVAIVAYGGTVGGAALASAMVALVAPRAGRRRAAALIASLGGVLGSLGVGVGAALLTEQPIIRGTLLTHALFAAIGATGGTLLVVATSLPARIRAGPALTGVLCMGLVLQLVLPARALAVADIATEDCRIETWSGSVGGEITLFSVDAGVAFDFGIGMNGDGSWDLDTAGSLKAGLTFHIGKSIKVPDVGGLLGSVGALAAPLDATNLGLEIKNEGIVRIGHRYRFGTEEELTEVLLGSLATFAWQAQALPGLGALAGHAPTLPESRPLPRPVETHYDVGTASSVSIELGPVSVGGELSSGVRVRFHDPKVAPNGSVSAAATVDVGFPSAIEATGDLPDVPVLGMTSGLAGDVYTYLTFSRTSQELSLEGFALEALGVSARGRVWTPPGAKAGIGTLLIGGLANEPGLASTLSRIDRALGPLAAETTSASVEASLEGLSSPEVLTAMLSIVLFDVKVADRADYAIFAAAYPELDQLTSPERVVDSLRTIIDNSTASMTISSSRGIELGLEVKGGKGLAFGFEVEAGASHESLVSANVMDAGLGLVASRTCLAPPRP